MVDSEQAYKFTVAKSSIKWYTITFDLCKEYAVDGGSIRGSADGGHYPNHERYEDNELYLQFKSEKGSGPNGRAAGTAIMVVLLMWWIQTLIGTG